MALLGDVSALGCSCLGAAFCVPASPICVCGVVHSIYASHYSVDPVSAQCALYGLDMSDY
jgi:hypothetical protein